MLLEVVVAAFVVTQLCYVVVNCGLLGLFLRRPANEVDERTLGRVLEAATRRRERRPSRVHADGGDGPTGGRNETAAATALEHGPGPRCRLPAAQLPRIRVLVPVDHDGWGALERTLSSIAGQSYPVSAITVYVAHESREATEMELDGTIGPNRPPGLEVRTIEVDRDALASDRSPDGWCFTGTGVSQARAGALTYAYDTQPFDADDVVTVLEAGTRLPVDTCELAVAGLEEYDIVQAKRTVGNADDGLLALLESMASAGWSDLCYASSKGSYHLLGSAYFTNARVLDDLDRWRREADGDVPLGLAAYRRGYGLGIVDRYARVDCPTALGAWVHRRCQWTREPYRHLVAHGWAGVDDVRCWTGTLLAQSVALVTVVGLPAALLLGLLYASGAGAVSLPVPVLLLVGFNGLVWTYCSVLVYRAAWAALPFRSRWHGLGYSILVNPFTQALYAMLWTVPIWVALVDVVRRRDADYRSAK